LCLSGIYKVRLRSQVLLFEDGFGQNAEYGGQARQYQAVRI
jgi:hypothetical protein